MPSFFELIRDICLLRRGPQDLPYSIPLLAAVAASCVIVQLGVAVARNAPIGGVLTGAAMWLVVTLGALNLILTLRGLRNRFVQSATALLGVLLVSGKGISPGMGMAAIEAGSKLHHGPPRWSCRTSSCSSSRTRRPSPSTSAKAYGKPVPA